MNWQFDDIEVCEQIGKFEEEYVYDIEVDDDSHTFIANDILVHNSIYSSFSTLLKTIKGIDKMSLEDKARIIVDLNLNVVDKHNEEFISEYYKSRHAKSVHKFEMETLSQAGCWLDVKKRYAQILLWKDGKYYDTDDLPLKIKGLEMVKASIPKAARESLKRLVRYLLEDEDDSYLIQRLNIKMQEEKQKFYNASIEDMSANIKVNNYTKYIIDDSGNEPLKFALSTPFNCKALGNYNWIRNHYKLPGEPIYGGKLKVYQYYPNNNVKNPEYFAFTSMDYPKWAPKYAPVAKNLMFQQYVIDPFNRILNAIGLKQLNADGSIQMDLFDELF